MVAGLDDLTRATAAAKVSRIIAEARYRILKSSNPELIEGGPGLLSSPTTPRNSQYSLLGTLRSQQSELANHFAEVRSLCGPHNLSTEKSSHSWMR